MRRRAAELAADALHAAAWQVWRASSAGCRLADVLFRLSDRVRPSSPARLWLVS